MNLNEEVRVTDKAIEEDYRTLVANKYSPLFEEVKKIAINHMKTEGINALRLGVTHVNLYFDTEGNFYFTNGKSTDRNNRTVVGLQEVYKVEAKYILKAEDSQESTDISVHEAMKRAFNDFRKTVKKSLADKL